MKIFSIQVDCVRQISKIHGRCPTEIDPRPLDGRLPTSRKNVTSAGQKPSRQIGLELSGDRRDIGYARSGAERVKPKLVAQIGFTEWTAGGKLRHPRLLGLRNDKGPEE